MIFLYDKSDTLKFLRLSTKAQGSLATETSFGNYDGRVEKFVPRIESGLRARVHPVGTKTPDVPEPHGQVIYQDRPQPP